AVGGGAWFPGIGMADMTAEGTNLPELLSTGMRLCPNDTLGFGT
ncbi:MAG: hypothetical protein RLY31_1615, partial [Bacteroidota bacterium]